MTCLRASGSAITYNTTNPNGGVLTLVGSTGVSSTQNVGFDISGFSGIAYASLTSPTGIGSSLFSINLSTGAASLIGAIGGAGVVLRGIAAPVNLPDSGSTIIMLLAAFAGVVLVQRKLGRGQSADRA